MANQTQQIKTYLEQGNTITHSEAEIRFGAFRLASAISRLRKSGSPIEKRLIQKGSTRYAEYYHKQAFRSGDVVRAVRDHSFDSPGSYFRGDTGRVVEVNLVSRTIRIRRLAREYWSAFANWERI